MNMRDAATGRLMWRSSDWDINEMFTKEIFEEIPKEILNCRVVSREIVFTSAEEMNNFRLEQRVYFKGICIEQWFFSFGYVMSGNNNHLCIIIIVCAHRPTHYLR
jgi:retinal rod rhodopsin-sensitive cGMP 3',5'-cyclic phosphodiesterase subunit delta